MGNKLKQININFVDGHSIDITDEVQSLLDEVKTEVDDYESELKAVLHSNYKYLTPEAIDAIIKDYLPARQTVTESKEQPVDILTKKPNLDRRDTKQGNSKHFEDNNGLKIEADESLTESANSNGVYSLYNGWVKRPEAENIPDDIDLGDELDMWKYKCDNVNTLEEIDNLLDDIYKMRYEALANGGEYSVGNLVFKELRNQGKLKELKDKKIEIENDDMSLN